MSEPSSRLLFSTKQLNINGGTFNEITGDYNQFHIQGDYHNSRVESGLNALSQVISHGAIHDSSERFPPAKCHPDTRKEVLRLIKEWIEDLEPTSPVFWLYGPAGAGKTAILQSIAELFCSSDGCWGASFFFSKGKLGRDQGHYLFTTIAYQLALNIPGLRDHINHVLAIDPTLHTKPMHIQLQRLIIDTFAQLKSQPQRTQVVVIDGLDECQGHEMQQGILSLISQALVSNKVPLRFLIASRPEAHIRESFDQDTLYTITRRVVLDESFNPSRDIKLFLQHGFADICARNSRLMSHVEKPWPREGIIDLLVQKSSGQFIYAATVLKFVGTEFFRPTKQLAIVLEPNSLQSTAFSDLDHLYTQILSVHPDPGSLVHLLGIIAALRYPQPPEVIEDIFNMEEGEVSLVLRGLHSLLSFPDDPEGHYKRKDHRRNHSGIRVLHASFYDYLVDETRSGPFHVDLMAAHSKLALAGFPFILRRIILPESGATLRTPYRKTWGYLKWQLAYHLSHCHETASDDVAQVLVSFAQQFWTIPVASRQVLFDALHCAITVLVHLLFKEQNQNESIDDPDAAGFERTVDHIVKDYAPDQAPKEDAQYSELFYSFRDILDECYKSALSTPGDLDDLIKQLPGILVQRIDLTIQGMADAFAADVDVVELLLARNMQFVSVRDAETPTRYILNQHLLDFFLSEKRSGEYYPDRMVQHLAICHQYVLSLFNHHYWSTSTESNDDFILYGTDNLHEHLERVNIDPCEDISDDSEHPIMRIINFFNAITYYDSALAGAPHTYLIRMWVAILQILHWILKQQQILNVAHSDHISGLRGRLRSITDKIYHQILHVDRSGDVPRITVCEPFLASEEYWIQNISEVSLKPFEFQIFPRGTKKSSLDCNGPIGVSDDLLLFDHFLLSMVEFLTDLDRAGVLYVNTKVCHTQLVELSLDRCNEVEDKHDLIKGRKRLHSLRHWKFYLPQADGSEKIFACLRQVPPVSLIDDSLSSVQTFKVIIAWLERLPKPPLDVYLRWQMELLSEEERTERDGLVSDRDPNVLGLTTIDNSTKQDSQKYWLGRTTLVCFSFVQHISVPDILHEWLRWTWLKFVRVLFYFSSRP